MNHLYHIIIQKLNALEKEKTTGTTIVKIYWLTNMACKIVYISKHFVIGNKKQIKQIMDIYNTIIQSKVNDLEANIANNKQVRISSKIQHSFINGNKFDILTINEIYSTLLTYKRLYNPNIKLIKIPHISLGNLYIPNV